MPALEATQILMIGLAFIASALLTGLVRLWAMRLHVIDTPNDRSMHVVPVPRGGGLSFAILIVVCWGLFAWGGLLPTTLCLALSLPPFAVALIGLLDDFRDTSRRLRLSVQLASAAIGILIIGSLPSLNLPSGSWQPSLLLLPLAVVFLVWLSNLFNFMDGINGLAGMEAVTVLAGAAYLALEHNPSGWSFALLVLAAIIAGFVPWNFPRARIFMGDCGSGFLGALIGLLALASAVESILSVWSWMILLGVFIVDATYTLARRFFSGQAWNEPHRRHAYQIICQHTDSHTGVTLGVVAINLLWLLPLAKLAQFSSQGLYWLILAYIPLIAVCLWVNAGSLENDNAPHGAAKPLKKG
jgi:Fuc2NAc and GlcNAc transferase